MRYGIEYRDDLRVELVPEGDPWHVDAPVGYFFADDELDAIVGEITYAALDCNDDPRYDEVKQRVRAILTGQSS